MFLQQFAVFADTKANYNYIIVLLTNKKLKKLIPFSSFPLII